MDRAILRSDLAAGNGADQAVDDDTIVGLNTGSDDPQPAAQIAGLHDLRHHRAIGRHRHHQMLRLVEHDSRIRQQQDGRRRRHRDAQPRELAGRCLLYTSRCV